MDDMCLLCLELWHESVDCIYVSSRQWEENNIELLIEQHFWPMDSITTESWICLACWHVLNEFHQFYLRVEDAHVDMALMNPIKTLSEQQSPIVAANVSDFKDKEQLQQIESTRVDNGVTTDKVLSINQLGLYKIHRHCNNDEKAQSVEQAIPKYPHENIRPPNQIEIMNFNTYTTSVANDLPESMNGAELQRTDLRGKQFFVGVLANGSNLHQLDKDTVHANSLLTIPLLADKQIKVIPEELHRGQLQNSSLPTVADQSHDYINASEKNQSHREDPLINPFLVMDKSTTEKSGKMGRNGDKSTVNKFVPRNEKQVIGGTNSIFQEDSNATQENENEPLIDYVGRRLHGRDPLKNSTFAKMNKIRKIKLIDENLQKLYHEADHEKQDSSKKTVVSIDYPSHNTPSDTTSDNDRSCRKQPSVLEKYKSRLTNYEYDEFLSKNFKIFCPICQVAMRTFSELTQHSATVHKTRGYVICCNRQFSKRRNLVEHIQWHCEPDNYTCKYCSKILATKRSLKLHEKHVHEKDYIKFMCDICEKSFSTVHVLKKHKLTHLSDEEKIFQCNQCEKKFGSNSLLCDHIRSVHMAKYVKICEHCGQKLRCRSDYERHELKHKGEPLPYFTCDICGLRLTQKKALNRHKTLKHPEGGKEEYKCHICSKVSQNMAAMQSHIQYKHKMTCDFKCTICCKGFKKLYTLKEHLAVHNKTPLFACPYCPNKFYSNANMHSHRKKDHPQEWLQDRIKKYSGKLPPNLKPPTTLVLNK